MKFNILTQTSKKIFFIVLLFIAGAITVYAMLFLNIKKKNEYSSVITQELKGQSKKDTELRVIEANLNETKNSRDKINSYFVQEGEDGLVYFMDNIASLGRQAGVQLKINSILLEETKKGEENIKKVTESMKLNLGVEGDWSDVVLFIKLLENIPLSISFDRVDLGIKETAGGEPTDIWESSLNLTVLRLAK